VTRPVWPSAIEHLVAGRGRIALAHPPAHLDGGGVGSQDVALLVHDDKAIRQLLVNRPGGSVRRCPRSNDFLVLDGQKTPQFGGNLGRKLY
jgi:hypothetical protein